MATESIKTTRSQPSFNLGQFIRYNVTKTWWLALWTVLLAVGTIWFVIQQLDAAPVRTGIILLIWLGTVGWMALSEINKNHSPQTEWLKENLYSSITNALISLILLLVIATTAVGFYNYAVVNASWSEDNKVAQAKTESGKIGARWGAVTQNFENLMVFRMKDDMRRVWASLALIFLPIIPTYLVFNNEGLRKSILKRVITWFWILSPLILLYFLRGFGESGPFPRIEIEQVWGGLLLSLVLSAVSIVASFPLGVALALGRQSQIRGIPGWVTYGVTILMALFLLRNTPAAFQSATSVLGKISTLWPLLLPVIGFFFQRTFKGNVVAAACTTFIESVRGVPLITLLFTGTLLLGIFLPSGWDTNKVVSVIVAMTLFSAAYLAENVRGGLQAIPKGQYEAADSLGLSTFNKYRKIVMPQALRIVIPAIVGQFIGLFKDTSLVTLVGLFDLLDISRKISSQPDWLTVRTEPFIFAFVVYFIGSFAMSAYSRRLERQLGVGIR